MAIGLRVKKIFMWFWLVVSIVIVVVALVLLKNQANLTQSPGIKPRLKLFLTSNVAEIKPQSILPELRDCRFKHSQADLYQAVLQSAQQLGWQIVEENAAEYRFHAVVTTALWRFKDDITVQIFNVDGGQASELHARSQSRVGRGDLAANAHHLQQLLAQLDVLVKPTP